MAITSLIEGDPVGAVTARISGWVYFVNLAIGIAPPGVVPSWSHVYVEGVGGSKLFEIRHKALIADLVAAIDNAELSIFLT